jgi:predicted DNA-binding protein
MNRKLDYLVRGTGRTDVDIIAQAVEEGMSGLYRKYMVEAYLSGKLDRKKVVHELGKDAVEELDYARASIDADIEWGMKSA